MKQVGLFNKTNSLKSTSNGVNGNPSVSLPINLILKQEFLNIINVIIPLLV